MIDVRSVRDLIRLFCIFQTEFRRALWATVVVVVVGALWGSPRYASEARLLVKPGRDNISAPLDAGKRAIFTDPSEKRDALFDEEAMLMGQPVRLQVARLYLAEQAATRQHDGATSGLKAVLSGAGQALGHALVTIGLTEVRSPEEALADSLAKRFAVSHDPSSKVLDLAFSWTDPATAQHILDTWVKVYLSERTRALGQSGLVSFYEGQVREASQQIELGKHQLHERLDRIHGISARERLDDLTTRINDLHTRRAELVAERSALQQGLAYVAARGEAMPREQVAARSIGPSPAWLALSAQRAELQRQRTDALRVFKDSAPAVKALDDSIFSLDSQLQAEARSVQQSERRRPNALGTAMARSELDKAVQLQELDRLDAAHARELAELETQRHDVLASEPELSRIEQALRIAEKNRGQHLDSLEKARVDQALGDTLIHNIAQIEPPTLNRSRVSPQAWALLLLALPMGAVAGLVVVYLCALLDPRIHDGGRIEARFGVPLWTTLQDTGPRGGLDEAFQASLHRIYGLLSRERIAQHGLTLGLTSARPGEGVSFVADHLARLLTMQGITALVNPPEGAPLPGQVFIREAAGLLGNSEVFGCLRQADLIVLVVEARASTVHGVDNALAILRTAYGKVHGVIVNRRRFEVPERILRALP